MMDFLAENYIWFFVIAVVLIFALIGFIVGSKRKIKKNEFKGEEVTGDNAQVNSEVVINDIPTTNVNPGIETLTDAPLGQMNSASNFDSINEVNNNELGSMPIHEFNATTPVSNNTLGETITNEPMSAPVENNFAQNEPMSAPIENNFAQNEPVIPTAPENFYDEPLMPEQPTTENVNFEVNNTENNQN